MKNILKKSLAVAMIALLQFNALAAAAPTKFTTDAVQFGKSGSALNKDLIFDKGSGATNPRIRYNMSTNQTEFSNDGSTFRAIGSGGGGGGGVPINGNANGDFEGGTNSWTSAGGGAFSIATVGTNLLFDQRSGVYNSSAGGQTLSNSLIAIPGGLKGANGAASCFFKTTATDYKIQVYDGAVVLNEKVIPALSVATPVGVTFTFPASGSVQIRILSQSNAADLAIDNCFLGQNALVDVSQASYVGGLTVSGCSTFWGTTSTSPVLPATQTGCVYTAHGQITAPSTNVPGFTIPNAGAGTYKIIYNGLMFNTSGSTASYFNMCSGSSSLCASSGAPVAWGSTDSSIATINGLQVGAPIGEWSWTQALPAANLELDMYLAAGISNTAQVYGTTAFPGTFLVYYFPSSSQGAMKFDTAAWRVEAKQVPSPATSFSLGTGAVSPSATISTAGGGTGLQIVSNSGSVAAQQMCDSAAVTGLTCAGNSIAGISFTPPVAGHARVCANFMHFTANNSAQTPSTDYIFATMDSTGATIVSRDGQFYYTSIGTGNAVSLSNARNIRACNVYNFTSVAPQYIALTREQGSGAALVSILDSGIVWTVEPIDQQIPAPLIVGGVISPSAGVSQVLAAKIATGCTTTPCTIVRQTGGVSSVTHNGTGDQTFNFVSGTFSSAPQCVCADNDAIGDNCSVQAETLNSVEVLSSNSSNTAANAAVTLMCIGPK